MGYRHHHFNHLLISYLLSEEKFLPGLPISNLNPTEKPACQNQIIVYETTVSNTPY